MAFFMGSGDEFSVRGQDLGEAGFEEIEAVFELPLFSSFFAGLEKAQAVRGRIRGSERLSGTGRDGFGKRVRLLPEAGSGEKVMLEAGAGRLFEVEVGEVELHSGACVFVGEIDA